MNAPVPLTIRQAVAEDAAAIARLIAELAESGGETSPVTAEYAAQYLAYPDHFVLLAMSSPADEIQEQVTGLLSYSIRPDLYHAGEVCLIEELVVTEAARGQGIGSALLTELFRRARAAGCGEVSVSTMAENTPAIRFYRAHGLRDEAVLLERHF